MTVAYSNWNNVKPVLTFEQSSTVTVLIHQNKSVKTDLCITDSLQKESTATQHTQEIHYSHAHLGRCTICFACLFFFYPCHTLCSSFFYLKIESWLLVFQFPGSSPKYNLDRHGSGSETFPGNLPTGNSVIPVCLQPLKIAQRYLCL